MTKDNINCKKNYLHIEILSIFPEMFPATLKYSLAGKGLKNNLWSYNVTNIRDFAKDKYRSVDDKMIGGGNGLIFRADITSLAIEHVLNKYKNLKTRPTILYPSPRGELFNQKMARDITLKTNNNIEDNIIIFLCGRFEGIDERIIKYYNIKEVSIGDYILSGGEVASIVMMDSMIRLIPGVIKNNQTLESETFSVNSDMCYHNSLDNKNKEKASVDHVDDKSKSYLLEYPLYTKPIIWNNMEVPKILLSGNHKNISDWKKNESIKKTKQNRPEFLKE
ncbi:MAG TPA: tRNA (guanine(37)-N(1))-methyltransferase [Candidatus Megaira endosymbiont of Hartmannula sinica]|nr:tRNA (guanine(37)-N(1))-methyltransferase [Candidatus Megaera endosymbiont of Hartmannula sinica]